MNFVPMLKFLRPVSAASPEIDGSSKSLAKTSPHFVLSHKNKHISSCSLVTLLSIIKENLKQ